MSTPRSIPALADEQVIVLDDPTGGLHLAVHRMWACCTIRLSPASALELADELRFRAQEQMADAPPPEQVAEAAACAAEAKVEAHKEDKHV